MRGIQIFSCSTLSLELSVYHSSSSCLQLLQCLIWSPATNHASPGLARLLDHVPLAVPFYCSFQILQRFSVFVPPTVLLLFSGTLSNNPLFYTVFGTEEIIISLSKAVSCSSLSYCVMLGLRVPLGSFHLVWRCIVLRMQLS